MRSRRANFEKSRCYGSRNARSANRPSGSSRYCEQAARRRGHEHLGRHAGLQPQCGLARAVRAAALRPVRRTTSGRSRGRSARRATPTLTVPGSSACCARRTPPAAPRPRRRARTWSMSCGSMRSSTTRLSFDGTISSSGSRGPTAVPARHPQRHHDAVHRRAHDLAIDLVLRRAQPIVDLAQPRARVLQLVGRTLLVRAARLRHRVGQRADLHARLGDLCCAPPRRAHEQLGDAALERDQPRLLR